MENCKLLVTYVTKKGMRETFLNELIKSGVVDTIRNEEGCIYYDYYLSFQDENVIVLLEFEGNAGSSYEGKTLTYEGKDINDIDNLIINIVPYELETIAGVKALSDLAQQLETKIDTIAGFKGEVDTRLQGSSNKTSNGSYWDQLVKDMTSVGAVNPFFRQEDFANNI
jgi:hypothetical protein